MELQNYCTGTVIQLLQTDAAPLWKQVEEGMRGLVATGKLAPGSPVPSVRDLARELRVNPATVARAYQRLTEQGIFTVARGEGTFVAQQPPSIGKLERLRALREAAGRYARASSALGAGRREAAEELSTAFDLLEREDIGGSR